MTKPDLSALLAEAKDYASHRTSRATNQAPLSDRPPRVVGTRNERLVIIALLGGGKLRVRCDCGVEKTIVLGNFWRTTSCGCYYREMVKMPKTHGLTCGHYPPEFLVWQNMRRRCFNPKTVGYVHYGGRGITVCERWRTDFAAFYADMGPRPSPKHSIDRIDTNGNYEPGNCRWTTVDVQARNRRDNAHVRVGDDVLIQADAADAVGITRGTLSGRRQRGWTDEEAVSTPVTTPYRRTNIATGTRFGTLTVTGEAPLLLKSSESKHGARVRYHTRCDCGNERVFIGGDLIRRSARGCRTSCPLRVGDTP